MVDKSSDRGQNKGRFSGLNPDYDLNQLVQLIERLPRSPEPQNSLKDSSIKPGNETLLAGRKLTVLPRIVGTGFATAAGQAEPLSSVSRIPAAARSKANHRRLLIKTGGLLLVVVALALFAWALMKSSDFTDVEHYQGVFAEDVHLSFSPGDPVPAFAGFYLVDSVDSWGDTFSDQDLIGKNTVIFVWGSWNEELLSWSQDINYQRLVDLENGNVQFVGLNIDQSKTDALSKLNEDLSTWPHIFNYDEQVEEQNRLMQVLGIQSSPLILLVDSTGRLRGQGLSPDELVEAYRTLF